MQMKKKESIAFGIALIFVVMIFAGCASKSTELLAQDPNHMNNDQLLEYFYRLNDEIEKQEKQTGPSFGIGIGGIGRSVGGGVGVGTGGTAYTADDLRERRIEVRLELKRRGIQP